MKVHKNSKVKAVVTGIAALVLAGGIGSAARAQSIGAMVPTQSVNSPLNGFDTGFLNQHPEIAKEIEKNPGLVNNNEFLNANPALKNYLDAHPTIKRNLQAHPFNFMGREDQLNGVNPHGRPYGAGYGNGNPNGYPYGHPNGWTPGGPNQWNNGGNPGNPNAYQNFERGYLSEHPDVAHELAANPNLVDNPQYMAAHPGLGQYLAAHPGVRKDLVNHPDTFMGHEDRWNNWQHRPGYGPMGNTDRYLSAHPDVAQELARNPQLVDNKQYLDAHPGLGQYLHTHPFAAHQWHTHPDQFMHREEQYQQHHR